MGKQHETIVNDEAVSIIVGSQAIYNVGNEPFGPSAKPIPGRPQEPTQPFQRIIQATQNMSFWGVNNTWPQDALVDIHKTPHLINVLGWKARALYGGGFVYGHKEEDAAGNVVIKPAQDDKVDKWLKASKANRFFRDIIVDFYYFNNIFPQIIMSKDHSQIAGINRQQAPHCRLSRQNPDDNNNTELTFINANWRISPADTFNSVTVPNLDTWYDPVARLKATPGDVFMLPDSGTKMDTNYYAVPEWDSIRQSKWLNLLQQIPVFKEALMKNQTSIKYLVEVPNYFWKWKYPNWESLPLDQKVKLRQKEVDEFDKMMAGAQNAGKSIFTTSYLDERTGILHPGWKITPIADMIKDGIYIEDSQEGGTMVYAAAGVNPTLTGMNPGQGMAAGSGSDEYVAYNNYHSQNIADEELIVAPFRDLIAAYNGWKEYDFGFLQPIIMSQNKGAQTNRPGARDPNKQPANNPDAQVQPQTQPSQNNGN